MFGLDIAAPVVHYALEVGLLDAAVTDDLEHDSPSPGLSRALAEVGLIALTGGVSYITERTFTALLDGARKPVWVSAFVPRTVSYGSVHENRQQLFTSLDSTRPAARIEQVMIPGSTGPAGLA